MTDEVYNEAGMLAATGCAFALMVWVALKSDSGGTLSLHSLKG